MKRIRELWLRKTYSQASWFKWPQRRINCGLTNKQWNALSCETRGMLLKETSGE